MAVEPVADMTLDELKQFIHCEINQQFMSGQYWVRRSQDKRSVEEILASIDQHRIKPRPGTPSTLEMLREDRDR